MKKLIWIGSSYENLKEFPQPVRNAVGYALFFAQSGKKHPHTKVLSGMGNANVIEIRENDISGTYRLIYTIEIEEHIFVLHAFQKSRNQGLPLQKKNLN